MVDIKGELYSRAPDLDIQVWPTVKPKLKGPVRAEYPCHLDSDHIMETWFFS